MHRAKAFFYVCAGVFLLALSYHLGAQSANAQAPGNSVVACTLANGLVVVTANGDVYRNQDPEFLTWANVSNVFSGGPTPALQQTWGATKARYRSGAAPQNR